MPYIDALPHKHQHILKSFLLPNKKIYIQPLGLISYASLKICIIAIVKLAWIGLLLTFLDILEHYVIR